MLEKLLENWLDSASERSYQPVFVQMLSAQGYTVVHSTRHTALEFGKDVLAVAPDGIACAYQLKGNPGGRLTLTAFRAIQPQLIQLMSQAVVFPGLPTNKPHRSYLVSNGFFDEEVQRAADDLNRAGYYSKLALVSRGELLEWANAIGTSLWPSELRDTRLLLQLFLADPQDLLPIETLEALIEKIVGLGIGEGRFGREQMARAIPAAALLVGIVTAGFAEQENHLAVIWAWASFLVMTIGALARHRLALKGPGAKAVALAEESLADALAGLWQEVRKRRYLVEGSPFTNPEIYHWRKILLLGALSCLAFKHEESPCLKAEEYQDLRAWLLRYDHELRIWGEGAIASLVPWLVWLQRHEPTLRSDQQIGFVVRFVIARNQKGSTSALANPYHSFESVYRQLLPFGRPPKFRETFAGTSSTALLLFHLLVRTNLKQACRELWPDLTKIDHRATLPDAPWEYCHLAIRSGADEVVVLRPEGRWGELRVDATKNCSMCIPANLAQRPWLLGLWWQIAPQRLTPDASRIFANALLPNWGS